MSTSGIASLVNAKYANYGSCNEKFKD